MRKKTKENYEDGRKNDFVVVILLKLYFKINFIPQNPF